MSAIRHQIGVTSPGRNSQYVAGNHGIPITTVNRRANIARATEHFAAHPQGPRPALYVYDVVDVVMQLGPSVSISTNEPEAM